MAFRSNPCFARGHTLSQALGRFTLPRQARSCESCLLWLTQSPSRDCRSSYDSWGPGVVTCQTALVTCRAAQSRNSTGCASGIPPSGEVWESVCGRCCSASTLRNRGCSCERKPRIRASCSWHRQSGRTGFHCQGSCQLFCVHLAAGESASSATAASQGCPVLSHCMFVFG